MGLLGLAIFFFFNGLVFLHTLLTKVVMVVVVRVVAFVDVAVVVVRDAVVVMVGMVMAILRLAVIYRRIDIFKCWLKVGDIGGVGIGCNVNSEFCGYFLSHHHN